MANEKFYWDDRQERAKKAKDHYAKMRKEYDSEIKHSITGTMLFPQGYPFSVISNKRESDSIEYANEDTVSAIFRLREENPDKKICALNFASYKNPGGKFLEGSRAQEESLCHESTLYNVLESFKRDFYEINKRHLNHALYRDNLLYSPDILFLRDSKECFCDIITCAAPNRTAARRYQNIPDEWTIGVLIGRINHILNIAYCKEVDILILGAYGCGVFGNDPCGVSTLFNLFLADRYKNCFDKIVFAIPTLKEDDKTFELFSTVGKSIYNEEEILRDDDSFEKRGSSAKYVTQYVNYKNRGGIDIGW
jgi:uncharacterized protein (TIGR02452 family)